MSTLTETDQLLDELRRADKLLLSTHEHPDGDALGSLLGMHRVLEALGKDSVMLMSPEDVPVPHEYRKLALSELTTSPPADVAERVIVLLDCGNIDRSPVDSVHVEGVHILNVDHHHDNTRFGTVNLVRPEASCTAEIVFELARELGVEITPEIAEPLYVGLVTDTGRFSHENVTPEAHHMAAELIEAGVDVAGIFRSLYQELPYARLVLLQHALVNVLRLCEDAVTATVLSRADFEAAGANETDSEGIIDLLRTVEGTLVAVLVRDRFEEPGTELRKVSLRATDSRVDVSVIARGMSGGGHRRAAGFTSALPVPEILDRVCREVLEQLSGGPADRPEQGGGAPTGVILAAKPSGVTSHDVVAGVRRRLGRGVKVGHAGTLDPFATGLLLILVGRATRAQRFLMALPKTYVTVARLGWRSDTGDRDGTLEHTGRVPVELVLPTGELRQRPPAYSAVHVDGERLYERARRGDPVEGAERVVHVHRFEQRWREGDRVELEVECSAGTYVRQLVAALGDAYCEELERTRIGPFALEDADPERVVELGEALAFLPERALDDTDAGRVAHGVALAAAGEGPDPVRLTHAGRLLAVYERRDDLLRALVVFGP